MSPYARVLETLGELRKDHDKLADDFGKERDKRIELEMKFVQLQSKFAAYVTLLGAAVGIGVTLISKWVH